jgi:predicted permease
MMAGAQRLLARLRALCTKPALDADFDQELAHHLESLVEDNLKAGMTVHEARRQARLALGGIEQIRELHRDTRGLPWIENLWRDTRCALRSLRKAPGFTATALATLALCLGANLAIFAAVDAVLLRPLPFPNADRLVAVINSYPNAGYPHANASLPNYFDRRSAIRAFASVSVMAEGSVVVGDAGAPQRVLTGRVTPEFFATLGVPLVEGKTFTDAELAYDSASVAILTDGFWRSHFHADPNVLGKTFLNDGVAVTVIGILPRDFRFLSSRAQFFRPLSHAPADRAAKNRHNGAGIMVARLAPGATLAEAQAQIDALDAQQATDDPMAGFLKGWGYHTLLRPLHEDHVREVKPLLVLLQGGGLFLWLIGTVNLANLLLIRASGRTKELAVRQALGAGWPHIVRGVLTENTLLALGGGSLGLLLGVFGIHLLATLGADQLPLGQTIGFDDRMAALSLVAALTIGALLAGPVVWYQLHANLAPGLGTGPRGGTATRTVQRLRHGFTVVQVALALVLLTGAGLLGLSLKRVLDTPSGFNPSNILTGQITLPWKNYPDRPSQIAFVERLLLTIRALPGVAQVAVNNGLPFTKLIAGGPVSIEGQTVAAGQSLRAHHRSGVAGSYWTLMGIPLLRGRLLDDADGQRTNQVCVIDQALADRYWPNVDPVGHRLAFDSIFKEASAATIVGVVGTVKQNELTEPVDFGAVYFPFAKFSTAFFSLVIRTSLPPDSIAPMVRKAVLELDPELPVDDLRTIQARMDDSLVTRRSPAILASIFAGVALTLAAIGTYGVLAYAVGQRRVEIGIRMALGAQPRQVFCQFAALGAKLLCAGVVIGVPVAWVAGRAMRSVLFEVGSFHPGIVLLAGGIMGSVVLLATLLPSRSAARVDPLEALRAE